MVQEDYISELAAQNENSQYDTIINLPFQTFLHPAGMVQYIVISLIFLGGGSQSLYFVDRSGPDETRPSLRFMLHWTCILAADTKESL